MIVVVFVVVQNKLACFGIAFKKTDKLGRSSLGRALPGQQALLKTDSPKERKRKEKKNDNALEPATMTMPAMRTALIRPKC